MQGVFPVLPSTDTPITKTPAPQTNTAPHPPATSLRAPLTDWQNVTATPDIRHSIGETFQQDIVRTPLPHFKLDQYTFFVVPRCAEQRHNPGRDPIRRSDRPHWLVPYVAKNHREGGRFGVPFSLARQLKIEQLKRGNMATEVQKLNELQQAYEVAKKQFSEEQEQSKRVDEQLMKGGVPTSADRSIKRSARQVLERAVKLSDTFHLIDIRDKVHRSLTRYCRQWNRTQIKKQGILTWMDQVLNYYRAKHQKQDMGRRLRKVKAVIAKMKASTEKRDLVVWDHGNEGAEYEPYTLDHGPVPKQGAIIGADISVQLTGKGSIPRVMYLTKPMPGGGKGVKVGARGKAVRVAAKRPGGREVEEEDEDDEDDEEEEDEAEEEGDNDDEGEEEGGGEERPQRKRPRAPSSKGPRKNRKKNRDSAAKERPRDDDDMPIFSENPAYEESDTNDSGDDPSDPDGGGSGPPSDDDDEFAIPFRDFIPADENTYDIDEEWLRQRVEAAERRDYEFAVRMQGLGLNRNLSQYWAPASDHTTTGTIQTNVQRFANAMVDSFYEKFVKSKDTEYPPESVASEVIHMQKCFSDEWQRQNKNTLSPTLESMGDAYVSLFFTGPLSGLKREPASRTARVLRRDERFRTQFALCLHHNIAKAEGTKTSRNSTYKQVNILTTQNLLATQGMWAFLQTHRHAIAAEVLSQPNPSEMQQIEAMFNINTMDWFLIADQLPAPRGRFAGYKHPETRDQDPDRQSKWQKIFDEESRIRNRGTGA